MKRLILLMMIVLCAGTAQAKVHKIATWNMKWLGTNSGNQLDDVENVKYYADIIEQAGAKLWALQEIGGTHSLQGYPRNYYLDLIAAELTTRTGANWLYYLDEKNKNQRLAFMWQEGKWRVSPPRSIYPGKSYRHIRNPYIADVSPVDSAKDLLLVNIHFKAFPDATEKRKANITDLVNYLNENNSTLDDDIIILGDTNIYTEDGDIDAAFEKARISAIPDNELSSYHEDQMSQRFDRFYISESLLDELRVAKEQVGFENLIDVLNRDDPKYHQWFDENISDHFPVILQIGL